MFERLAFTAVSPRISILMHKALFYGLGFSGAPYPGTSTRVVPDRGLLGSLPGAWQVPKLEGNAQATHLAQVECIHRFQDPHVTNVSARFVKPPPV